MLTNSENGKKVRKLYIEMENLLFDYKDYIINGLNDKIGIYNKNSITKTKIENKQNKGIIYVFRAYDKKDMFKIGMTKDIKKRYNNYNTGKFENIDLLFIYETENVEEVEKCQGESQKEFKIKNNSEIYEVELQHIKKVTDMC